MSKTILLVEDEPLIALLLEDVLVESGFDVMAASCGSEAIEALEKNAPQLTAVVTDIKLGSGPNGWHIGHRARELEPALPVLYMSGDSAQDWPHLAVPNSEMLTKPFALEHLVAVVSKLTTAYEEPVRMPRFFFDVIAGETIIEDLEGTELPDIDAARSEATKDIRSLMSAAVLDGWDISRRSMAIRNEAGEVVSKVAFSEAVTRRT